MQALAERLEAWLDGATFEGYTPLGFSGLKTYDPPPEALVGRTLLGVGRRAKYLILDFDDDLRMLVHLSQAGRIDFEQPPKTTKPKGSVVRLEVRRQPRRLRARARHRTQGRLVGARPGRRRPAREARARSDERRVRRVGAHGDDGRRVHTILRDQRTVAGVGRGYADDILHRAKLSPYASLKSMKPDERERLLAALHEVLADGLERERTREGGLSQNKLGEHFTVHGKRGVPCPVCGDRPAARLVRVARGRRTARRARPAARSSPTAASPASSNEGSCDRSRAYAAPGDAKTSVVTSRASRVRP